MDYKNYLEEQYFGNNQNEKIIMDEITDDVKICDVFIDLGASFGLYTKFACENNSTASIYSFEPDKFRFKNLKDNVDEWSKNRKGKCSYYQNIVYNNATEIEFFSDETNVSGLVGGKGKHENCYKVSSKIIDEEMSYKSKNIVMKIDIEGAELAALQGSVRLLKRNNVVIVLEVHTWGDLLSGGGKPGAVLFFLYKQGYRTKKIKGRYVLRKDAGSRLLLLYSFIKEYVKSPIRDFLNVS